MIRAITFDFWNTLYRAAAYARPLRTRFLFDIFARNQIDVTPDQVDEADEVARNEWNRIWREDYRTPSAAEWVQWMLEALMIQLPQDDFNALARYFDRSLLEADPGPTLLDGAADAVRRLARHYRLGVISDAGLSAGRTLREFLIRDQLIDCFAHLTFSDELGMAKPHARAFLSTLDHLQAKPHEAVHVGDLTRSDIAGAKSVGMKTVRIAAVYDDADRSVAPDAVVYSFREFEKWLSEQG
jgi:putative hydrolase of the HAD superfamily